MMAMGITPKQQTPIIRTTKTKATMTSSKITLIKRKAASIKIMRNNREAVIMMKRK